MPDRFPFTAEVRNMLRQAEFYRSVNYNCIYYTIHEAVVIGEEILDDEAKVRHIKPSSIKLFFLICFENNRKCKICKVFVGAICHFMTVLQLLGEKQMFQHGAI